MKSIDQTTGQILTHKPSSTVSFICNPRDLYPRPSFIAARNLIESYGIVRGRSNEQEEIPVSLSDKVPISPIYYSLLCKIVLKLMRNLRNAKRCSISSANVTNFKSQNKVKSFLILVKANPLPVKVGALCPLCPGILTKSHVLRCTGLHSRTLR
eukprot:TRINITY_DN16471_c0_g2_i1.p1 TRINITY_DN16471_c0_g2~~TRINITY_DN16471_c0_g2_i1.p1  ORF type:complete len:154 (+),score=3.43 TRINITY_DN16471_c0_g2_i1:425-886(+)